MPVPSARRFRAKIFRAMLSRPVRQKTCLQHVRTVASPGTRRDDLEFPFCFLATEEYTPECQAHHLYLAFRPRPEPERATLGHCRGKQAMTFPISRRFHEHLPRQLPGMMFDLRHYSPCRRPTGGLVEKALVPHDRFVTGTPTGRGSSSATSRSRLSLAGMRMAYFTPLLSSVS